MTWLTTLLIVVQVLSAIAIIVLVLLQHGKGADMGAAFGGGASGSLFGATGSANFLSRSTAAVATVFFVATLALAYVGTAVKRPAAGGGGHDAGACQHHAEGYSGARITAGGIACAGSCDRTHAVRRCRSGCCAEAREHSEVEPRCEHAVPE
jgi:preprotein translocase subunit SecG